MKKIITITMMLITLASFAQRANVPIIDTIIDGTRLEGVVAELKYQRDMLTYSDSVSIVTIGLRFKGYNAISGNEVPLAIPYFSCSITWAEMEAHKFIIDGTTDLIVVNFNDQHISFLFEKLIQNCNFTFEKILYIK